MLEAPVARIQNLHVSFATASGQVGAVRDVSFELRAGETLCIVGESGSGKSVSALSLMRLVDFGGGQIEGGQLLFETAQGHNVDLASADQRQMQHLRGNQIGMIFQEPMTALNPVFTIGRQLSEGVRRHENLGRTEARARAFDLLRQVGMPDPVRILGQYPHELSGGMRQRVVIAMAMACRPRLLIADEPTTALDVTIQAEILSLIKQLQRDTGMAVLFITHDMAVVAQMADRVAVMHEGHIVEEGSVDQVFTTPRHGHTKALLAAVPRLGAMRGRVFPEPMALTGEAPRDPVKGGEAVLLEVNHLGLCYPVRSGLLRRTVAQVHAVQDVSFTLNTGRTLSLVGESGCGKSSVGRAILRLVEPTTGRVVLDGADITALGAAELQQTRQAMQMVFQDPFGSLNPRLSLAAQVAEPLWNYRSMTHREVDARVGELFDRVGLPRSLMRRYPHELSGGQRQRVAIARALALEPKLIVADEAVSALDGSVQAQVLNLLLELQRDLGLSILFISHDMAVVERMSHDVAVMQKGRIVEIGPRAAVIEEPQHPYTQALLDAVPVADPAQRDMAPARLTTPPETPVYATGCTPAPSTYREVSAGHRVLIPQDGC
ncbi:dipeptide ABC transporter ATP-binding protein [Roseovarius sp. 2305UL8-3]|uniref:ABC transporter ATP-binding protein n=1 Tax=Roseovarius conchicola TaxID=3121636 RepID=UPI0035278ACC